MASARLLSLLFFLLASASAFADFWYIDCGNSEDFTDDHNISWFGDDDFVRSGQSYKVKDGKQRGTAWETLRAFPKNKKNCYTIPVGEDGKIEVTAQFYYGNYDGKSNPPTFELLLDSNDWATVTMSDWVDRGVEWNTIYTTRSNSTSICLGRLHDDQDPFISVIMVSMLDPSMYPGVNSSNGLYNPERLALGADASISYPDDRYDRSWSPIKESGATVSNYTTLKSNASITVNTSRSIDDPPAKMFSSAATPLTPSKNLTITTSFLGSDPSSIYLNMYFTEISSVSLNNSKQTRSFHIYMDNELISDPITPPFGEALEFTKANLQANQNTSFILVPASGSTLPPIISGFEVLQIFEFSLASTDNQDCSEGVGKIARLVHGPPELDRRPVPPVGLQLGMGYLQRC